MRIPATVLIVLSAFLLPAKIQAAPPYDGPRNITIEVINSKGVPQPGARAWVEYNGKSWNLLVSEQGIISARPYSLGSRVYASRALYTGSPGDSQTAPEGYGVYQEISVASPGELEIVLPALEHPSYVPREPEVSVRERAFVGLANDERQRRCLQPLEISTVLSAVADRYANYIANERGEGLTHYWYWNPNLRAVDGGFTGAVSEANFNSSTSPRSPYQWFLSSPQHSAIVYGSSEAQASCDGSRDMIGVGMAEGKYGPHWVVMPGSCGEDDNGDKLPYCGPSGDYGDSSLADASPDPEKTVSLRGSFAGFKSAEVIAACSYRCSLLITGKSRRGSAVPRRVVLAAGERKTVRIRYSKKLRRAVARPGRIALRVKASYRAGAKTIAMRLP